MPVEDSNTFALYRKGWRGVAMEPLPYQQPWQQSRPEDVFLNAAIGEETGYLTLQVYDETQQISSGSHITVEDWRKYGFQPTRSIEVPMFTLDHVIAKHAAGRTLHLLCIDVEGMEHQVLKGLNLNVHRLWVILLEATVPGSPVPAHQEFEQFLPGAGARRPARRLCIAAQHMGWIRHGESTGNAGGNRAPQSTYCPASVPGTECRVTRISHELGCDAGEDVICRGATRWF